MRQRAERMFAHVSVWAAEHRRVVFGGGLVAAAIIVIALAVAINLAAATFALVAFTALATVATMIGWRPLQARPRLQVGLWHDGALHTTLTVAPDRTWAPIDIDTCVLEAVRPIRNEIPAMPAPGVPTALGVLGSIQGALGAAHAMIRHSSERLEGQIPPYEEDLRKWLREYEERRYPTYATIEAKVGVHNSGEILADGVILRIRLAADINVMDADRLQALEMPPPPMPPHYQEGLGVYDPFLAGYTPSSLPSMIPNVTPISRGSGPTYVEEHGHTVAEVRLDEVTHGVTEKSDRRLAILPAGPGIHELPWEAHVSNLPRPLSGSIRIEVGPIALEGDPLRTIDEVLATGDVKVRD